MVLLHSCTVCFVTWMDDYGTSCWFCGRKDTVHLGALPDWMGGVGWGSFQDVRFNDKSERELLDAFDWDGGPVAQDPEE